MFHFDPMYLLFVAPALLLAMFAQMWMKSAYATAQQMPAPLTGAAAARHVLNQAGLNDVPIEQTPGHLSDHYDPNAKVLRLSPEVFQSNSLAAVGIAAHEAGHAMQDAKHYAPLKIRNAAVSVASIGSNAGMTLLMLGVVFSMKWLLLAGIILFSGVVFFQVVNLPVEFDASRRAKEELVQLGIVPQEEMPYVRKVLTAAALTYVAATLQSILTLLYYLMHFSSQSRRDDSN
jgi:Zn-dependent membrane protease YugP